MLKIISKITTILLVVVLTSIGIDAYYRSVYEIEYVTPKNVLPKPSIEQKYTLVKVGNSHPGDGITFEKYKIKALDLTGAGQELRYDLAFLKHHANEIDKNAVILISITPITFSQRRSIREDGLQASYYGRISPLYIPFLEIGDYLQYQWVPFFRSGLLIRQKNTDTIRDRLADENSRVNRSPTASKAAQLETTKKPEKASNLRIPRDQMYFNVEAIEAEINSPSKGRPEKLEESMHFMFRKWYNEDEFSPIYFEENRKDLEQLVQFCLSNGWRPVMITIPISQVLEDGLADDYKQIYIYDNIAKLNLPGVDYFDFSTSDTPKSNADFFSNSDHLNKDGAALFSYLLLQKLIEADYLPSEADGYDYEPLYTTNENL